MLVVCVFMPNSHLVDVSLQAANVPNLNELFFRKTQVLIISFLKFVMGISLIVPV